MTRWLLALQYSVLARHPAHPRSFQHDQQQLEVTCVLFARDEKRGSDSVYAAGWNRKVRRRGSRGPGHAAW